jgi:hypothetical protein
VELLLDPLAEQMVLPALAEQLARLVLLVFEPVPGLDPLLVVLLVFDHPLSNSPPLFKNLMLNLS